MYSHVLYVNAGDVVLGVKLHVGMLYYILKTTSVILWELAFTHFSFFWR